jgi:hypothetical protein
VQADGHFRQALREPLSHGIGDFHQVDAAALIFLPSPFPCLMCARNSCLLSHGPMRWAVPCGPRKGRKFLGANQARSDNALPPI